MYTNTFGQNYNKFNNSDKLEYPSDNSGNIGFIKTPFNVKSTIINNLYNSSKDTLVYKNGAWSGTYTTSTPLRLEEIYPIINDNILYIYDIYGRLIYQNLDIPTDFSSYINGIYFFKINNVVTKKMIIN